jgi:RNA 3'-terminal phosphate cyclase
MFSTYSIYSFVVNLKGKKPEDVGKSAADDLIKDLSYECCVDEYAISLNCLV